MRHGEAKTAEQDPQRGLTDNGNRLVGQVAQMVLDKGVTLSTIYHTDKTRAAQTARIVHDLISPAARIETCDGMLPNDSAQEFLNRVPGMHDHTLLVSHLPFLPGLLAALTQRPVSNIGFLPATWLCLERQQHNRWRIAWTVSPTDDNG